MHAKQQDSPKAWRVLRLVLREGPRAAVPIYAYSSSKIGRLITFFPSTPKSGYHCIACKLFTIPQFETQNPSSAASGDPPVKVVDVLYKNGEGSDWEN